MFIIRKEFSFCASHTLMELVDGHPCARLHGHNYVVVVELRSETLNKPGMVRDYRELAFVKEFIDGALDHRHLNDLPAFNIGDDLGSKIQEVFPMNPTAENMARHFYNIFKPRLPELFAIEVSETPKTNARYEA